MFTKLVFESNKGTIADFCCRILILCNKRERDSTGVQNKHIHCIKLKLIHSSCNQVFTGTRKFIDLFCEHT